jgi:hypothetical protein
MRSLCRNGEGETPLRQAQGRLSHPSKPKSGLPGIPGSRDSRRDAGATLSATSKAGPCQGICTSVSYFRLQDTRRAADRLDLPSSQSQQVDTPKLIKKQQGVSRERTRWPRKGAKSVQPPRSGRHLKKLKLELAEFRQQPRSGEIWADGCGETSPKAGGLNMAICEVCGNDYDKTFEVVQSGRHHTFDSFECAIQALAPTCQHCSCRVIGHGIEDNGRIFCCAHCANAAGSSGKARDRVA